MKHKRILTSVVMAALVLVSLCAVGASALSVSATQGSSANAQAPGLVAAPVGAGAPGVCSQDGKGLDLFIRGSDNALYWKDSALGTIWPSTSAPLGGVLASAPSATSLANGKLEVFVRGTDGALWWTTTTNAVGNTATWSKWASLGGQMVSNTGPAACLFGPSNYAVFVHGTDGALWWTHSSNGGTTWTGWASLGGKMLTAPGVTALPDGSKIALFVAGTDSAVWYRQYTSGSWSAKWVSLGGKLLAGTSPAAYNWGTSRIGWLVTGTDSGLWHNWVGGSSGYENVGGALTSSPAATSRSSGSIDVFARGSNVQFAALYQTGFNTVKSGLWSDWTPIGGT